MACPNTQTPDWVGKGHVAKAATTDTTTRLHDVPHPARLRERATTSHNIILGSQGRLGYDPGEATSQGGCYACHGNSTLLAPRTGPTSPSR